MTSLRQRRREQTSRDIRLAALELCHAHGVEHVTVDAISARAGISLRTFFNYFANKEAAIVGRPPKFPEPAIRAFQSGHAPVLEDLRALLAAYLTEIEADRAILILRQPILAANDRLQIAQDMTLAELTEKLAGILALRLPGQPASLSRALSAAILHAVGQVLKARLQADVRASLHGCEGEVIATLRQLGAILATPQPS